MAIRRVVLAKTIAFQKGRLHGAGTDLQRYLQDYMDGVGKTLVKHGEIPKPEKKGPRQTEKRHLLKSETKGTLHTGGFLGNNVSPGHPETKKQKGWIRRLSRRWTSELQKRQKRTNDGVRFVLSMAPRAVADLTESKQSTHQALLTIWEKTIELYRTQHGWDKPEDEIGWVMGAHDDTDNYHFHIILFPTTKSGKNLKTQNNGNVRGQDLNQFTAMANIATEIYWREHLGIEYQDPEYQKAVSLIPSQEPPLPQYEAFDGGNATTEPVDLKREAAPKIRTSLIAREMIPGVMIGLNTGSPIRKTERRGLSRFKSLVCAALGFKTLEWVKRGLHNPAERLDATKEKFPADTEIISKLAATLKTSSHRPTSQLGEAILKDGDETTHAIMSLVLGNVADPDKSTIYTAGAKLAANYQKIADLPEEAIEALPALKLDFRRRSTEAKVQTQRFRNALKAFLIHPDAKKEGVVKTAMELLSTLVLGSERLSQIADATIDEITAATKTGSDKKPVANMADNDWNLINGKMTLKKGKSLPWPLHFDPATVFAPLDQPGLAPSERILNQPDQKETARYAPPRKKEESESVVKRIVRIIQPKEMERRRVWRQMLNKEKEASSTPDL